MSSRAWVAGLGNMILGCTNRYVVAREYDRTEIGRRVYYEYISSRKTLESCKKEVNSLDLLDSDRAIVVDSKDGSIVFEKGH